MMSRNPWQALVWTQEAWKYLAHTRTMYTVVLPDQTHGVRIAADASFAPGGDRSRTGAVILVSGVIVHWLSQRQTEAAASAHEAELTAAKMGSTVGLTIIRLVTELLNEPQNAELKLDQDNKGTIRSILYDVTSWRTRHYADKAAWLRDVIMAEGIQV